MMSEKKTEKEREKIESKGAYSFDLHDAIRDVRYAFGEDSHTSVLKTKLDSLFDVLAPEIREAVNGRWSEVKELWSECESRLDNLSRSEAYKIDIGYFDDEPLYFDRDDDAGSKCRDNWDGIREEFPDWQDKWGGYRDVSEKVYKVSDGEDVYYFERIGVANDRLEEHRKELESNIVEDDFDRLRVYFRIIIDALDNHGELRKWRDVEYGKV